MDTSKTDLVQGHYMWSTLYYFIAENALRYFGAKGECVIRMALRRYGRERGDVMRRRQQEVGSEDPLDALINAYDLPVHPECEFSVSGDEKSMSIEVFHFPIIGTWESLGGGDSIDLYLQEVPSALVRAFDRRLMPWSFRRGTSLTMRISVDSSIPESNPPEPWTPRSYDDDTGPIVQLSNNFGLLYYHLARAMVDELGASGKRVLMEGIETFGKNRGFRMRKDHLDRGMSIDLETMTNNRDMPRDDRTTGIRDELTPTRRLSRVFRCQYHEIWAEHEGSDVGQIYCDVVHHAIWQAYHPGIELDLAKTLTRGDEICLFDVTCDLEVLDDVEVSDSGCDSDAT